MHVSIVVAHNSMYARTKCELHGLPIHTFSIVHRSHHRTSGLTFPPDRRDTDLFVKPQHEAEHTDGKCTHLRLVHILLRQPDRIH